VAGYLKKMAAAGFITVSCYFDWGYHSPAPVVYDFTGVRDLDKFLDAAAAAGLHVIARPGPYINSETDSGGFPASLTTIQGRARSTAPDYLASAQERLSHIDPVIARHQLTNGTGTAIACQVENEFYDNSSAGQQYMQDLENKMRSDGITVPLTGNHDATFLQGLGATDIPGFDLYPQELTRPTLPDGIAFQCGWKGRIGACLRISLCTSPSSRAGHSTRLAAASVVSHRATGRRRLVSLGL
jgi:beta-galactosidase